jgi:cytochrome c-type biogenesis protein CcmH
MAAASVPAANDEIRTIEEMLVSPCCWREQISLHDTPQAKSLRAEVRSLVLQGRSRQEILAVFVDRYGYRILTTPPAKGFFLLTYLLPSVVAVGGALTFAFFLYRAASVPQQTSETETRLSGLREAQIEEELRTYVPID